MLKLHQFFSNGAIIQRNAPVIIKGYSDEKTKVTLNGGFYCNSVITTPVEGVIYAELPPVSDYKSEFELILESLSDKISVRVLFGDVYITMGQSNMSYVLSAVEDSDRWIEMAKKAKISILSIDEKPFSSTEELTRSYDEQFDFPILCKWRPGTDEAIGATSAISVQLAVYLWQRTGVPIGVVHTATGGLSVDSYIDRKTLISDTDLVKALKEECRFVDKENWNQCGGRNFTQTSCMWNERIAPLKGISLSGCVWYLGESSAYDYNYAQTFKKCLSHIITDIHQQFGNAPFVTVGIAPENYAYGDGYGYLYINEALQDLSDECENVYYIPIYDIEPRWLKLDGDEYFHPIHTTNKALVSERICECIRGGRKKYPSVSDLTVKNDRLIVKIKNVETQLVNVPLCGFAIAGEKGKYYPADAKVISRDEIELYSADVKKPSKMTYAFLQYQDFCNARTIDGAPLLSFRSDRCAVTNDYYFSPAYLTKGAKTVYENNFGYDAGFCRKIPVWSAGKIYRCKSPEISVHRNGEIIVESKPLLSDYKFFGVSPEICLCGHKNHLADYKFLQFTLKSKTKCGFWGVILKLANGNIYRYKMTVDNVTVPNFPLTEKEINVSCDLKNVFICDGSPKKLSFKETCSITEIEFLFRSSKKAIVSLSNLLLTDKKLHVNKKTLKPVKKERTPSRADINLPS